MVSTAKVNVISKRNFSIETGEYQKRRIRYPCKRYETLNGLQFNFYSFCPSSSFFTTCFLRYSSIMLVAHSAGVVPQRMYSAPRNNRYVQKLCGVINETETVFPGTNLRMVYDLVSNQNLPDQEFWILSNDIWYIVRIYLHYLDSREPQNKKWYPNQGRLQKESNIKIAATWKEGDWDGLKWNGLDRCT